MITRRGKVVAHIEPVTRGHGEAIAAVTLAELIIAATAAASGRTVVSADRRAFDGLPGVDALDHQPG